MGIEEQHLPRTAVHSARTAKLRGNILGRCSLKATHPNKASIQKGYAERQSLDGIKTRKTRQEEEVLNRMIGGRTWGLSLSC